MFTTKHGLVGKLNTYPNAITKELPSGSLNKEEENRRTRVDGVLPVLSLSA